MKLHLCCLGRQLKIAKVSHAPVLTDVRHLPCMSFGSRIPKPSMQAMVSGEHCCFRGADVEDEGSGFRIDVRTCA